MPSRGLEAGPSRPAHDPPRPINVLICARGGEGGGVLMNWIVAAATEEGLPVQATSVPGVAQRTGATTYYVEIFPLRDTGGREPVLALYPAVGDVDLVVASELLEVGRALERGWVSPERTVLVGSTHRVYSIAEKSVGDDGRYDPRRILDAAPEMARKTLLFDAREAARQCGSRPNAVLLGALAGTGELPVGAEVLAAAMRREGKATEVNLAGFNRGLELARGPGPEHVEPETGSEEEDSHLPDRKLAALTERVGESFPQPCHEVLLEAVKRLVDYQGWAYAELYLRRLQALVADDRQDPTAAGVLRETGRQLALLMSYEDVVRVAQLKTRRRRFARVRAETGAEPGQIVRLTEFLKPSIEELCSLLPSPVARPVLRWAEKRRLTDRLALDFELRTSSTSGFLALWSLARLRRLRPLGHRYGEEQRWIEEWLELVHKAWELDRALAREVVECARLVKGYGQTRKRGLEHLRRILGRHLRPCLLGEAAAAEAAQGIRQERAVALAEPERQPSSGLAVV